MKQMTKYATIASVAGALALGMAAPSHADNGRNTAAAIGFGAGALTGAAVATAATHDPYGPRYEYRAGYAHGPAYGYAEEPVHTAGYRAYAYAPRRSSTPSCVTRGSYQGPDYSACGD